MNILYKTVVVKNIELLYYLYHLMIMIFLFQNKLIIRKNLIRTHAQYYVHKYSSLNLIYLLNFFMQFYIILYFVL